MTTEQKNIKTKVGIDLAKQPGNVSQARKIMGARRDSFDRFKELSDPGGEEAWREISRRKPTLRTRSGGAIEDAGGARAIDQPAWGQHRLANELAKQGVTISPAGVRGVGLRHDRATLNRRLQAWAATVAQAGRVLTEAQLAARERVQPDTEAHGEFESACPGDCGAHATFDVGTLNGVGRIDQQPVIDTDATGGVAKLATEKTITAADRLNDRVVPCFEPQGIPLRNTHGIWERFNTTLLDEVDRVAVRTRLYATLDDLPADVDRFVDEYHTPRPHQGRW